MSERKSRLQRKARSVVRLDSEREADAALTQARVQRDKDLTEANEAYRKTLAAAQTERSDARTKAWRRYEETRDEILRGVAAQEQAA